MLRMKTFVCDLCGEGGERIMHHEDPIPLHCKNKPMRQVIEAPAVHYRPHFSHTLNRKVSTFKEEEREIEKKGWWIASKSEANSAYSTDIFKDDVTIKNNNEENIRKHVEKAAKKLVADGVIRSGKKGFEMTKDSA